MSENFRLPDTNSVIITGRLTRDPALTHLANGTAVCKFCIAHNERRKGADGAYTDKATFFDCQIWKEAGERVADKLYKGCPVTVEGKLSQRTYEHRDGHTVNAVEIVAFRVTPHEWQKSREAKAEDESIDGGEDMPF